jgi:hypothetical protein
MMPCPVRTTAELFRGSSGSTAISSVIYFCKSWQPRRFFIQDDWSKHRFHFTKHGLGACFQNLFLAAEQRPAIAHGENVSKLAWVSW